MNGNIIVSMVLEIRVGIKKSRLRCCSHLGLTLEELGKTGPEPLLRAQFVYFVTDILRKGNQFKSLLMCAARIETVRAFGPAIG